LEREAELIRLPELPAVSESAEFGPSRASEIIRRLCLLVGALAAAWCLVKPVDAVFRVRDVDFARLQKEETRRILAIFIGLLRRVDRVIA